MKKNSLVTPSPILLGTVDFMVASGVECIPKPPEEGDIYTCTSDVYITPTGRPCISVDGLTVKDENGEFLDLDLELWIEVQPPMEVDIEAICEKTEQ